MVRLRTALTACLLLLPVLDAQPLQPALARVAEEAEALCQNAPRMLAEERLEQKAQLPPSRFRPRLGSGAMEAPKPQVQVREVVSEYSVGLLRGSATGSLLEYRQVVSVDGKPVRTKAAAQRALSAGKQAGDEWQRKRLLQELARYGLVDVATDYGMILLAFTTRGLADIEAQSVGTGRIGADEALVINWKQKTSASGALEFNGRQVARRALQGRLWVRRSDSLPLRIEAWEEHPQGLTKVRDEATVEYVMSQHGFLTPASVVHRHLSDGAVLTENRYTYSAFKLFTAGTEIKFTGLDSNAPATDTR
jgi:hypothetical protein